MRRLVACGLLTAALAVAPAIQLSSQARRPRPAQTAGTREAVTQPRQAGGQKAQPQPREHGKRIAVDPALIQVDDGDTVVINWKGRAAETVRILGIDSPETRHPEHNLPYGQAFGEEARAFAQGAFALATRVELLRAATLDPFGRTLGYIFVNGHNYSVAIVRARLAAESITQYGDNGFPAEAAAVLAEAKRAGPLPFEPPYQFRGRMRDVTRWMKEQGIYPEQ